MFNRSLRYTLPILFVIALGAGARTLPALAVRNGTDVVRAKFMWLDFGNVANNTVKRITVGVRNVSRRSIAVDAFSWSQSLKVRWANPKPDRDIATRSNIEPGEEAPLVIDTFFSDSDQSVKAISLMNEGFEILQIVGKETIRPATRLKKTADQRPAAFLFSGNGEGWSGWYKLCLGEAPPGYSLEPASVKFNIQELPGVPHFRRCNSWAVCEELQRDNKDVCFRFAVQGHHEGGLMQVNDTVRFTPYLEATYVLNESVALAPFDAQLMAAFEPQPEPKPKPGTPARSSQQVILAFSVVGSGAPTLPSLPAAPPLYQLQPQLVNQCNSGQLDSCVQLGLWVTAQENRPDRLNEAESFLGKACTGGKAKGCTGLGLLQLNRHQVSPAKASFQKACDIGDGRACYELGRLYRTIAPKKALTAFAAACRQHFPAPGCQGTVRSLVPRQSQVEF